MREGNLRVEVSSANTLAREANPDDSLAAWALAPVERFSLLEPDARALRLMNTLYFDVFPQSNVN